MATVSSPQQGVPSFNYPIVNKDGTLSTAWYQFFISMWQRTGGATPPTTLSSLRVTGSDGVVVTNTGTATAPNLVLSLATITPQGVTSGGAIIGGGLQSLGSISGVNLQFGTFVVDGAITPIGYMNVTDVNGTTHRLIVG